MAVRDFTANQIRAAKLIMTGSATKGGIGHQKLELSIYSESVAPDEKGGTPTPSPYGKVGPDVSIFVSGSQTSRGGDEGGSVLFHGDTFVSGTLVVEGAGRTGSGHGGSISGSIHHTATGHTYLRAGTGIAIASGSASGGQITISSTDQIFSTVTTSNSGTGSSASGTINSDQYSDTLNFEAGNNIAIVASDSGTDNIKISSTCCDDPVIAAIEPIEIAISSPSDLSLGASSISAAHHKVDASCIIGPSAVVYDNGATSSSDYPSGTNKYRLWFDATTPASGQGVTAKAYESDGTATVLVGHFAGTTLEMKNGGHTVLHFEISAASNVVTFALQPSSASPGTADDVTSGGNKWENVRLDVPFLVIDRNGNTQTINKSFTVRKVVKGEKGKERPKASFKPNKITYPANSEFEIPSSEIDSTATNNKFYGAVISGNFSSIQNDTVGSSIPSSNNRYNIDLEDDGTNGTSYIAFGKGTTGPVTLTSTWSSPVLTLSNSGTDIVKLHYAKTGTQARLYVKSIESNTYDGSNYWEAIIGTNVFHAKDNVGDTHTNIPAQWLLEKIPTKKEPMSAGWKPGVIKVSANQDGVVDASELDSTPTNNKFFKSFVQGNFSSPAHDTIGTTFPSETNKYNLDLADTGTKGTVYKLHPKGGGSIELTPSYTGTTLTLKNNEGSPDPNHTVAELHYVDDGTSAKLHLKDLSPTYDGTNDWLAIVAHNIFHAKDNSSDTHTNVLSSHWVIEKQSIPKQRAKFLWKPNMIKVPATGAGTIQSGVIDASDATNNPGVSASVSGDFLSVQVNETTKDTIPTSNNRYDIELADIGSNSNVEFFAYPKTGSKIPLTPSYAGTVLTLKNTTGSPELNHTVAELHYEATSNQARLFIKSLANTVDGSSADWTAITCNMSINARDNSGNAHQDEQALFSIEKLYAPTDGKEGARTQWNPQDMLIPSNGLGVHTASAIDSNHLNNPFVDMVIDGNFNTPVATTNGDDDAIPSANNQYNVVLNELASGEYSGQIYPLHTGSPTAIVATYENSNSTLSIGDGNDTICTLKYVKTSNQVRLYIDTIETDDYNDGGTSRKWGSIQISLTVKAKDNSGNDIEQGAGFRIKKDVQGDDGKSIKTVTSTDITSVDVKVGDVVVDIKTMKVYTVTQAMINADTLSSEEATLGGLAGIGIITIDADLKEATITKSSADTGETIIPLRDTPLSDANSILTLEGASDTATIVTGLGSNDTADKVTSVTFTGSPADDGSGYLAIPTLIIGAPPDTGEGYVQAVADVKIADNGTNLEIEFTAPSGDGYSGAPSANIVNQKHQVKLVNAGEYKIDALIRVKNIGTATDYTLIVKKSTDGTNFTTIDHSQKASLASGKEHDFVIKSFVTLTANNYIRFFIKKETAVTSNLVVPVGYKNVIEITKL